MKLIPESHLGLRLTNILYTERVNKHNLNILKKLLERADIKFNEVYLGYEVDKLMIKPLFLSKETGQKIINSLN